MIKHSETRYLRYSITQMFDLVADIEAYPYFIPWCSRVNTLSRTTDRIQKCDIVEAEMRVSFKVFSETFSSRIWLDRLSNKIVVKYLSGPFKFLNNEWIFTNSERGCRVDFFVEFEFKSKIMQRVIGVVFNEAMRRVVWSFEKRAEELYNDEK